VAELTVLQALTVAVLLPVVEDEAVTAAVYDAVADVVGLTVLLALVNGCCHIVL